MTQPSDGVDPRISRRMRANPPFDTGPEIGIRSQLHRAGFRFFKHRAPWAGAGFRPDIVFKGPKLALFIDGCFWHGCPEHRPLSIHQSDAWRAKVMRTIARDRQQDDELLRRGWEVVRIWEHEDPLSAVARVAAVLERRKS
jgi:DNA mismatch endonuclease (patch repair protein)